MKDMPLGAAIGSVFFFLNLGMELSKHTIHSSNNQAEMEAIQEQLISAQSGVGINQFMGSLTEILQGLKISLN
jgi:ribonuclease HI